jgi:hypothetical protein
VTFDPSAHVDEQVVLTGSARTGAAGPLLRVDGRAIYIDGLDAWAAEVAGRTVRVSGVLRFRPTAMDPGARSHGLGDSYAVEDARWSLAEDARNG